MIDDLPTPGILRWAYRTMCTIRAFEDTLHEEWNRGRLTGSVHLSAGQEAAAVGVCARLTRADTVASTHRGHGHCIARGLDVRAMMAELYGKATGICGGKAGSLHLADFTKGMLGTNGVVGAGVALACGAALTSQRTGGDGVAVAFLGDGALNQGIVLESLNLAAVWRLPVVFIVENNGWAESTSASWALACDRVVDRAVGFGMPGSIANGSDFFDVHRVAGKAVDRARSGEGPSLVEITVPRYYGHAEGDAQTYRGSDCPGPGDAKDCLRVFGDKVLADGTLSPAELSALRRAGEELVGTALAAALSAPWPEPAALHADVYTTFPEQENRSCAVN
ncbi:thiamine pyrophosphate-dependent dehydrogenase E1 component subunit alpha [Actinokineospora sp. HUAS TT18]|uniref:thiamine pyrophosphate-dependent dehydrogenase E1 component subunit alpha n=1 Tax=Actinokineospora sp. HUAS TT18 TaxID=3447451 RepID=UPI003F51CB65